MTTLAEALSLRSSALKRLDSLRERASVSARYQEGEEPAEDAGQLVAEAEGVLAELEDLIRRINRTNSETYLDSDTTLTDALARRDVLKARHKLYTDIAQAATGGGGLLGYRMRQMRTELRSLAAVSPVELRAKADEAAKQYRELDARIQQKNWATELAE